MSRSTSRHDTRDDDVVTMPAHPFADPDALAAIRAAFADPGQFTPRLLFGDHRETIPEWGARAVPIALVKAGYVIVADQPVDILALGADGGWSIEHRPACRRDYPTLTDCAVHKAVLSAYMTEDGFDDWCVDNAGDRFRAYLDDADDLVLEREPT